LGVRIERIRKFSGHSVTIGIKNQLLSPKRMAQPKEFAEATAMEAATGLPLATRLPSDLHARAHSLDKLFGTSLYNVFGGKTHGGRNETERTAGFGAPNPWAPSVAALLIEK
jgi:hypothetical protein